MMATEMMVPVLVVLVEHNGLSKRLKRAFDAVDAANLHQASFKICCIFARKQRQRHRKRRLPTSIDKSKKSSNFREEYWHSLQVTALSNTPLKVCHEGTRTLEKS
jgi:hypothetical protein